MHIKIVTNRITEKWFYCSSYEELISSLINNIPGAKKETDNLKTFWERENFLVTSTFPLTIQKSEYNRNIFNLLKKKLKTWEKLEEEKVMIVNIWVFESYIYFNN